MSPSIIGKGRTTGEHTFSHHYRFLTHFFILPAVYIATALKIAYDTGYSPWDWQFLAMFVPVILFCEQVVKECTYRFSDA
jgi:hypothetical protein